MKWHNKAEVVISMHVTWLESPYHNDTEWNNQKSSLRYYFWFFFHSKWSYIVEWTFLHVCLHQKTKIFVNALVNDI